MNPEPSLYARIGGQPTIDRIARCFYARMETMPEAAAVRAMHRMSLDQAEERLRAFLSGFLGGPDLYRSRYGEPMMRRRHLPFPIGHAQRDAWLACMARSLDEALQHPALRQEVFASIAQFDDHMRNRDGRAPSMPRTGPTPS